MRDTKKESVKQSLSREFLLITAVIPGRLVPLEGGSVPETNNRPPDTPGHRINSGHCRAGRAPRAGRDSDKSKSWSSYIASKWPTRQATDAENESGSRRDRRSRSVWRPAHPARRSARLPVAHTQWAPAPGLARTSRRQSSSARREEGYIFGDRIAARSARVGPSAAQSALFLVPVLVPAQQDRGRRTSPLV